jgi:hypothetical protein
MPATTLHPAKTLAAHLASHGAVALLLVGTLMLAEARAAIDPAGLPGYLAAGLAVLVGLGLSHIIHEWCHFLGAKLAGATVQLKAAPHPLFFDFDFSANTPAQFLCLAAGGLLGNGLLLAVVALWVAPDTLVMTSLLAAVAGQLVFVLMLELPVPLAVIAGREPLQALTGHFSQGAPLFLKAGVGGIATAAAVLLLR